MKKNCFLKIQIFSVVLPILLLNLFGTSVQGQTEKPFEKVYPGLASGPFKEANLVKLPKGTLVKASDLIIKESEITKLINQSEPAIRKQLTKNVFYLLENITTKRMLLLEASKAGFKKVDQDQAIRSLLSKKIKIAAVSEEELKKFHNQNKEMLGNAPFEEIREMLKDYLTQQKREEALQQYISTLGQRTPIRINAEWAKKRSKPALNNPVDQARRSGKPTMVEFGAPGCPPCEQMVPVLAELKKKFSGKLNVLFLNVGQEQILGARFGIEVIPVQVFFDKNGLEVYRHTGFFPQAEIEKTLNQKRLL